MPIFPDRCQAVATDGLYVDQRRLLDAETLFVLQHAGMAAFSRTPGAGTGPTQGLPTMNAFMVIAPRQDELAVLLVEQKRCR